MLRVLVAVLVLCSAAASRPFRSGLRWQPTETKEPLLLIVVVTGPKNRDRRDDVRNGWMQHPMLIGDNPKIVARFMLGQTVEDPQLADELKQHSAEFVRLPMVESYENLRSKTTELFKWAASADAPKAKFVMKLDDDTYPNFEKLVKYLDLHSRRPNTYLGRISRNYPTPHNGRWGEPGWHRDHLPTYALGSGYVLSADLAQTVSQQHAAQAEHSPLRSEDTTMGWLVELAAGGKANYVNVPATVYGCGQTDVLSMQLGVGKLACMHGKQRGGDGYCCDGPDQQFPVDAQH